MIREEMIGLVAVKSSEDESQSKGGCKPPATDRPLHCPSHISYAQGLKYLIANWTQIFDLQNIGLISFYYCQV